MNRMKRWFLRRFYPDVLEALIWMTGSSDFDPGGKAGIGFAKVVAPVLRRY